MTKRLGILTGLVMAFALACRCFAAAQGLPSLTAPRCAQPPVIDGALDDACWKTAAVADNFYVFGKEGQRSDATTVRVTVDDQWLYFGFSCANPQIRFLKQTIFDHDANVQQDDSVEIFLDPGTDGALYFQYLLSFANVKGEKRVTKSNAEIEWNVPWRSATRTTDAGWTAEVAIPLSVFPAFGEIDRAAMNLARNRVVPQVDPYGMKTGEIRDNAIWSPVVKGFHEPDRFGGLKGLDGIKIAVPFLGLVEKPAIGRYYQADGKFCFDVSFTAQSVTPVAGSLAVTVVDTPAGGAARGVTQDVALKGNERREVTVRVPVDSPAERTVALVVKDPRTGEQIQSMPIKDTSVLNLMSIYLDRSYYTDEKEARAICAVGLPPAELKKTTLAAVDAKGRVLGRQETVLPESAVPIPLADVPLGTNAVRIEFRQKGGGLIFSQSCELIKRAPKPGFEMKMDRANRYLLRDGKPFFPFGIWLYGITAGQEAAFRAAAECGFNTVTHWVSGQEPESVPAYQAVAAKYGLLVLGWPEAYCKPTGKPLDGLAKYFKGPELDAVQKTTMYQGLTMFKCELVYDPLRTLSWKARADLFNEYYNRQKDRIYQAVALMAKEPNLLGYNMFDEPIPPAQGEALDDLYRKIQELDGYRPAFVFGAYDYEGKPFTWTDVIEYHPYWVPTKPGSANRIGVTLDTVARASREQHRPFGVVHLAEFRSGADKRPILRDEQFCQCYIALIHGVSGLYFFRWPLAHEATWNTLKELSAQMKTLTPIVLSPAVAQEIKNEQVKAGPEKDPSGYPDINMALKRNPAGGYVLLAVNARPYPVEATIRVAGLADGATVGQLFAKDTYTVAKGAFTDLFKGYGVRAYSIPGRTALPEPVAITVQTTARLEGWVPEEIIQFEGRTGKKNLVRNPGIEDAVLPGWPDYFLFKGWWEPWDGRGRAGSENPLWGPSTEQPFEGKSCLRVVIEDPKVWNGFSFYLGPQSDRPLEYTFSVYLRADRDGVDACFECEGVNPRFQWFKLTKEWTRHSYTLVLPARTSPYTTFGIGMRGAGVMFADGVQVERGPEATAFEN